MIPEFPTFTKLSLGHQKVFNQFTAKFEPYSDFNFTSLFCWDTDGSTEVSTLNQNLVVRLPDYITSEHIYSLLGKNNIDTSLTQLLAVAGEIKLVPEVTVKNIHNSKHFKIIEDEDNYDYVYALEALSRLEGRKYKDKRIKTNSVRRAFGHKLETYSTEHLRDAERNELQKVFAGWAKHNRQTAMEIEPEKIAFSRLLEFSDYFNLLITLVQVGGETVAFSVNEPLNNQYAISHFEKAIPVHGQIFSLVINEAAKEILKLGCKFVNWEQDLGLNGLKKSKSSYHPVHFLKKYVIQNI